MLLRNILLTRYTFAFMAMLGLSLAYMMRLCFSLVIIKLVPSTTDDRIETTDKTYSWNEQIQGIILEVFYAGYMITHIPGGYLSEKFGGKYTLGLGILSTAIFTLITPWVIDNNPIGIIILRFLEGVGEGAVFPTLYTFLARWAPPKERNFLTTFALLGKYILDIAEINYYEMFLRNIFKARYIFAFMAMIGISMAFMMRLCLSLVIIKLVPSTTDDLMPTTEKTYAWSEATQGIILAAFYAGYLFTHVPGSYLSEKFGGKYTFGLGILSTAIFTLITPWVVDDNPIGIIILRFLEGVGEGTVFPALYTLLARWAPPNERNFLTAFTLLGSLFGSLLSNIISGVILQYVSNSGWKLVFYLFGSISIIWYIFWWGLCFNDPQSHPYISEDEKEYFVKHMGSIERDKNLQATPWKHILTSRPVWALIIAEIGHDWGTYILITDFSKYLNDVLKFNPVQNGLLFTYSYISIFLVAWVASRFCDWILGKRLISVSFARKLYATATSVILSVGILTATYVENYFVISACVIVGMSSLALDFCSIKVIPLDLSPNYCGSIFALMNGIGCISGILTPYLAGLLTPNRSAEEWRMVFWIMGGVLIVTNFIFLFFGSCKLQPWNDLNEKAVQKFESTDFQS